VLPVVRSHAAGAEILVNPYIPAEVNIGSFGVSCR
jgi:hypothetical protein